MATSLFLLVALASLLPQVAVGHSSFRSGTVTVASKACSCDCCLTEQEDQSNGNTIGTIKCAPKSGTSASADSGGCSDICMLPNELRTAFLSEKGEADYSRYCMSQCKPVGNLHDYCVDASLVADEAPAIQPAVKPTKKSMALVGANVGSGAAAASESALVLLAKQKMQEAKLQAEAAGQAAFTSRTAYERLKLSVDQMAMEAGKATLAEIKAEAAQTSKQARDIRLAYENNAKATAIKNALAASGVYNKAMVRDMALANVWQERAGQFATAANQRETMAMDFSAQAEDYRKQNEIAQSKQRIVMAHQAVDQASAFAAQSESAHKQAQAIKDSEGWYLYAKKAIAAFILAKSMPHDVAPPPMPPIP